MHTRIIGGKVAAKMVHILSIRMDYAINVENCPPLPRARNKFPVHSNNWTIIASAHHSHSSYLRRQSNRWEISGRAGGGGGEGAIASRRIKPRFRPTTGRVHLTHLKERAEENDKNDQTADCRGIEGGREVRGRASERASEVGLGS